MSKIDEEILAEAGFPNTPQGRAAFYKYFPTKEDWESYKQMKHGGSLSGAPHNGQPTADEFFSFGDPTYGNLNIPFGNFAYGGYFAPGGMNNPNPPVLKEEPRGATKVSTVDPGYNMLGSVGSKTFYDKKADKAISSPGSGSGASGDWKQSMISRLQSGVSPQSLVEAGHISKDAAKDFEQYYKPVYTETAQTTPATSISKPQSTPLKDSDKIDRKWFSSPGNQSQNYDSYMYPDVNSGYANPTRRYFDKKTGQEIDPAKSYTDKGDYAANFIQGAPGAEGTLKQTRINTPIGSATDNPITMAGSTGFAYGGGLPNGANEMPCMNCGGYMDDGGDVASPMNYGAFPNTEYGGMLDQSNMDEYPVFQEGGNEFEKGGSFYSLINNLKKAKKKLFSKGGDTVMQGGNATDYPGKRREEFDNAIKTNLHNSLVEEEGNSMLEQYKQMGGPQLNPQNQAYQQMLQQNINQGQAGLNQAANNLYSSTMDVFNTMGTKEKTKVKEVKAQKGIETKETKETEVDKKAAEREKLLDQIISQYQESQKQPKRDYYPYGYAPQQYGYPAHQYNQGYGMGYFPMNYGYKHSISSSDVEALKKLANNPSSNLREFSHRNFGPWSKTKMTFGYKDQLQEITPKGNATFNEAPQKGFTEGFPAVHTVEDMPERRAAELKNKLQSLPRPRENYKDMDFEQYANDMLNPSYPQYTPPVQETYNPGFKDMSYEDQLGNQYENMVEVNPLQKFIPKEIMMDRESQLNIPIQESTNDINNNLPVNTFNTNIDQIENQPSKEEIKKYNLQNMIDKIMKYEATKGGYNKKSKSAYGLGNYGYNESQLPYNKKSKSWKAPKSAKEAAALFEQEILPRVDYFSDDALKGRAADFLYNSGRDPRVYMMDQYLRTKGEEGLPNRGAYNQDTKTANWTPELEQSLSDQWGQYGPEISKLSREEQIKLLDQGRDWYYQHTAPKDANWDLKTQGAYPAYNATWKGRIDNLSEFQRYGGLHKAVEGVGTPISFPNWGNTSFGQTPQFSTPESVGYSKPVQSQSVGQTFGNTLSDKTTSFRSDIGPEKQVEVTQKSKPKFNQEAMANWEIAGADMISSGLEQISEVAPNKRNLKASTVADNASIITPENAISQGDTEINLGRLRSPDHTPVQFHGQSVAAYGGFMQDGGMQQQDGREQQIMQGVAQMLQQGAESEQILEQLVEMGLPEEQASEIIDTVINQLQMSEQQQPEQEQMQPAMRYGGYANGGMYEEGQELDLTPQEIAELIAQGYSIEELD